MAVVPDKTLILLLENKEPFLGFIDLIDGSAFDTQVPIPMYNKKISGLIKSYGRVQSRRIVDALSLDNLHRNGFLLDWNKKDGFITFKPWLVEMLRHLDSTRLKELTDKDLENLRGQLFNLNEQFDQEGVIAGMQHPDFAELVTLMFNTLNTVNDRLQQNMKSLDSQSQRLSEILDSEDITAMDRSRQMKEALNRVYELQDRHIKPMLQFIDERQDYKDMKNPIALVQRLEHRMQGYGYPELNSRVVNIRISMISHGKKIKSISRLLGRYIRQDREERGRYNKVEGLFNELLGACRETLHDGNQKTKFIPLYNPVFDVGNLFLGVKMHSQSGRQVLSWRSDVDYEGYVAEKTRAYREGILKRIDKPTAGRNIGVVEAVDIERARRSAQTKRLLKTLEGFTCDKSGFDANKELHEYLKERMENYWLGDLVESVPIIKANENYNTIYTRSMNEIEYNGYRLRYQMCQMESIQ